MSHERTRIAREKKTAEHMILLYCTGKKHTGEQENPDIPCPGCAALLAYARSRLESCQFGEKKTTCSKCPVHCYEPGMREEIREVMRYSGPRMLLRHPILAILHLVDELKRSGR